jgi:hypothetical protein
VRDLHQVDELGLSLLNREQGIIGRAIVDAITGDHGQLFLLQGSAGTGKTFTVNAIVSELRRLGKRCLITATTGIAAVQYLGGTTVHSLFKLGIDENARMDFRCNIGRDTPHARYLSGADLIVIDEVSMLTPWVANRVSLTLKAICENEAHFGGKKILFVGDLLQLPPVSKGSAVPILQRLIVRMECWEEIRKFRLLRNVRTANSEWADFLHSISWGMLGPYTKWKNLAERFGVTITPDYGIAQQFFRDGVGPAEPFPLDRQWICATNRLAGEVNMEIQNWRAEGARFLGRIYAATDLVSPLPESPGLSLCQQRDFIEKLDLADLPPHELVLYEGDCLILLRNLDTSLGLAKGRRCTARQILNRTVVVCLDDGREITLARMPMEKVTNGMKFKRWQLPLRLMFAGTVHRSQGMTLSRVVLDLRAEFWEHGQSYVGLSRVRDPRNICILIPNDRKDPPIKIAVDHDVVNIVREMSVPDICKVGSHVILSPESEDISGGERGFHALVCSGSSDDDEPIGDGMGSIDEVLPENGCFEEREPVMNLSDVEPRREFGDQE